MGWAPGVVRRLSSEEVMLNQERRVRMGAEAKGRMKGHSLYQGLRLN